jgi:hypothetical protein
MAVTTAGGAVAFGMLAEVVALVVALSVTEADGVDARVTGAVTTSLLDVFNE